MVGGYNKWHLISIQSNTGETKSTYKGTPNGGLYSTSTERTIKEVFNSACTTLEHRIVLVLKLTYSELNVEISPHPSIFYPRTVRARFFCELLHIFKWTTRRMEMSSSVVCTV